MGSNGASPVTQGFTGARQANAGLMRTALVHELLGGGRAQELTLLDGRRFAIVLPLPAEPRSREPPGGRRERAS